MALDRNTRYSVGWDPSDPTNYQGKFLNRTSEFANDGAFLEDDWANDLASVQSTTIYSAFLTLNNTVDEGGSSQYMEGLVEQVSGRSINYDCAGPVNAYVLTIRDRQYGPQSYFDGMKIEFTPNITNTGASTVDVNGLGIISITDTASGGELPVNTAVRLRYNSTTAQFQIIFRAVPGTAVTTSAQNGGTPDQTFGTINLRSPAVPAGPQGNFTYGVSPGTAEVMGLRHNGPDNPKWEFTSAIGGDSVVAEGGSGACELKVFGDAFSGSLAQYRIPNANDFFTNNGPVQWFQDFVTTRLFSFASASVTTGGSLAVAWPFAFIFSQAPPGVQLTATISSGGGAGVATLVTTTGFTIVNNTSQTQPFYVLVIGTK